MTNVGRAIEHNIIPFTLEAHLVEETEHARKVKGALIRHCSRQATQTLLNVLAKGLRLDTIFRYCRCDCVRINFVVIVKPHFSQANVICLYKKHLMK